MTSIDKHIKAAITWHSANRKGRPRERKPVSLPSQPTQWDRGADGPANQDGMRTEPATEFDPETGKETPNPNGIKRRRRDSWVDRYFRAGHLTEKQAVAAMALRMASEGMRERDPLAALRIDRMVGQSDPEAARVDNRAWFRRMWAKVPQSSRPVLERVVLDDLPIWRGCGKESWDRHMSRLLRGLDAIS